MVDDAHHEEQCRLEQRVRQQHHRSGQRRVPETGSECYDQQAELADKYGDRHPEMVKVRSAIQSAEAKLQVDDIILQYDGIPIEDDDHLVNLVGLTTIGKEIPVTVFRDRKVLQMSVKVGDRSRFEAPH